MSISSHDDICDHCICTPEACGSTRKECLESLAAEAGDLAVKARKERDL